MSMKSSDFNEIAGILRLTADNARIEEENCFPVLIRTEDGNEAFRGIVEVKRAFPFECDEEFLVLSDEKGNDQGFIRRLSERTIEEQTILRKALDVRYFMPKILCVEQVNDRYGFAYFKVKTDAGKTEFSVRDPYKSIIQTGNRLVFTDADGNRYEIPDLKALDKKSKRKIEPYLW